MLSDLKSDTHAIGRCYFARQNTHRLFYILRQAPTPHLFIHTAASVGRASSTDAGKQRTGRAKGMRRQKTQKSQFHSLGPLPTRRHHQVPSLGTLRPCRRAIIFLHAATPRSVTLRGAKQTRASSTSSGIENASGSLLSAGQMPCRAPFQNP